MIIYQLVFIQYFEKDPNYNKSQITSVQETAFYCVSVWTFC